jgi:ABC-type amino acid transport substrate-binding protein
LFLERGTIDIILSGLDITQERQNRMNLIPYCGEDITSMYLIFYKQIPQGIASLENLAKRANITVCVEANSTSEKLVDVYPTIIKKQLKSVADMILDIRYGKSTAALAEPSVARRLFKKDLALRYITVSLPKQLCIYGNGIAIKKENISLTKTIKDAIQKLRASGELDTLEKKWNLKGE